MDVARIKGSGLKNFQRFIDHRLGENAFNNAAKHYDANWQGPVLISSWYDAEIALFILNHYAPTYTGGFRRLCIDSATFTLEQDLNGIYQMFMRLGGAVRVLNATPTMVQSYSNFVAVRIVENQKGNYTAEVTLPSRYFEWQIAVSEGAIGSILKVCGQHMQSFQVVEKNQNDNMTTARYRALYQPS